MTPLRTCSDCPAPRVGRKKRCPDCQREHDRRRLAEWRAANPERVKAQQKRSNRARYERDPGGVKRRTRAYAAERPEQYAGYSRAWRARNPERHAFFVRRVRERNPAAVAERTRRYQARKMAATVEKVDYGAIGERDGWICGICSEPVDPTLRGRTSRSVSFDHIVPLSKGGKHMAENIQPAHFGCNSRKGAKAA